VFNTLVRHPYTYHYLALPYILYPPIKSLRLRPLTCRLRPYYYILHPYILYPYILYPRRLYPRRLYSRRLYLLTRPLTFSTYYPPLILYTLSPSLRPQAYIIYPLRLPLLASPLSPLLTLYPIIVRALMPNYFYL